MARGASTYAQISQDRAERIGIEALGFLAAEPAMMTRFFALSGYDPGDVRAAAASPDFLAGVLEFLLGDESALLVFAGNNGLDPDEIAKARQTLAPDPRMMD